MKLSKLLYFVDKEHLLSYGRTVIGDRYIKMEFGPVPSSGYNLMNVCGNDITLKAPASLRHLSETDREALDVAVTKYGNLTPAQLSKISHREPAWRNAEMNAEMDYRLFFAGVDSSQEIQCLVEDDQALRDALVDAELEEFIGVL